MVRTIVVIAMMIPFAANAGEWIAIQGKNLDNWRGDLGDWVMADDNIKLHPDDPKRFAYTPGIGAAVNGEEGRTKHLVSKAEHADVEAHIEFMVPKGSNSGVYFMGRYEIQVLDSWGVREPAYSDCGGIYEGDPIGEKSGSVGVPPRVNAALRPGEWQTYDVKFKAPRFDADGDKIADAEFIEVRHNGVIIHENEKVTGPTRAAMFKDEKPTGPIMLQGDHGPVAYRNVRIRELEE